MSAPRHVRHDLLGGDALGRGDRPALSWWLPAGAIEQTAYRIATSDGFDTGRVESATQSRIEVPVFDVPHENELISMSPTYPSIVDSPGVPASLRKMPFAPPTPPGMCA